MIGIRLSGYGFASLASLAILGACSGAHPVVTTPSPESKTSVTTTAKADLWLPQRRPVTQEYLLHDSSTITVSNDSSVKPVPIVATTYYSVVISANVAGGDTATLSSTLDSAISSAVVKKETPSDLVLRQELHAVLTKDNTVIPTSSNDSLICTGKGDRTARRIFEIIAAFPQHPSKIGDSWSDTVSSTTCHGKTPLVQQSTRRYQIVQFTEREGRDLVEVQRNTTMTFGTLATQMAGKLNASGTGSSVSTLYLDRNTGLLIESKTESRVQLIVTTSRGTFPFTQTTDTHITAR